MILFVINLVVPIRVAGPEEETGLDLAQHGEVAYQPLTNPPQQGDITMVIAALVSFAILLVAWIVAPERTGPPARPSRRRLPEPHRPPPDLARHHAPVEPGSGRRAGFRVGRRVSFRS